jgi:hypothetical protein
MKIWHYYIFAILIASVSIYILFKRKRNKRRLEKIDYSAEGRNIALGISKCKPLHKQLVKAIHPDRFDEPQKHSADELMQKINASKYDYQQLSNFKIEVEIFLNKKL